MNDNSRFCCPRLQGFLAFLVAGLIAGGGYWLGSRNADSTPGMMLPPHLINATASDSGDQFSIATGTVSGDAEGLFVLDHATGQLQCYVLYPRTSKFGAVYTANVAETLPAAQGQKGAKYLMVTGGANLRSARNGVTPAGCVVYVLDAASGNFVAYGMNFSRSMVTSGQVQQGILVPIESGQARQMAVRE